MKVTEITKTVTTGQWAKFIPIHQLADNLIRTAGALMQLPEHVRGKVHMSIQIATEVDGAVREKRTATKSRKRSER